MTKIKVIIILIFLTFFTNIFFSVAYAQNAIDKREKELAKTKRAQQKKEQKAVNKRKERHLQIQTKETRKRMKASEKKSRELAGGKKEFYFARFFKKRRK